MFGRKKKTHVETIDEVEALPRLSDEDAEKVTEMVKAKCPNHVEVSHIRGGQPVYYYMISVE